MTDIPLTEADIRQLWEERAAIYEADGNMTRAEAEDAARYWLHGYWYDHQVTFVGWEDWTSVQDVITRARNDRTS